VNHQFAEIRWVVGHDLLPGFVSEMDRRSPDRVDAGRSR
jgi:hypothetical protein